MNRKAAIALPALMALLLSGPVWAQKIGSESIQNDPLPQGPATPVAPSVPAVATGSIANAASVPVPPGPNMPVAPNVQAAAQTPAEAFIAQAGSLLHASSGIAALAQDKSSNPAIQDMARSISSQDDGLLSGLAALSSQPSSSGNSAYMQKLQALKHVPSGDAFDAQYESQQAGLAQQLATAFQDQAQTGTGPLKDFAATALPGLQQSAAQALALQKQQPAPAAQ